VPPDGSVGAVRGERIVRPEFTGSAREYFRIWIVNLFFTLVTLGVYSAWAKVRKKRYFYGSTRFDGDSFDYFASPKAILKGRIVAFVIFIAYALAGELWPYSQFGFWAAFVIALPWLVVRALAFNARNSGYRGLRFDFAATPVETIGLYIGIPLVVLLSLGFAYPWFAARQKQFIVSHHSYGARGFECEVPVGRFFGIYYLAGLALVLLAFPAFVLIGFLLGVKVLPEQFAPTVFFVSTALFYLFYAVVYAYVQAHTTNLMWNGTLGPGVRFASSLKGGRLARLYLGNLAAIAASGGLLIPWAAVRTLRYRLECLTLTVEDEVVHAANAALERVGATGQELGDIFNLDLGL
jgi:uncharacterized membrane protein YjgN (DUF898 family)